MTFLNNIYRLECTFTTTSQFMRAKPSFSITWRTLVLWLWMPDPKIAHLLNFIKVRFRVAKWKKSSGARSDKHSGWLSVTTPPQAITCFRMNVAGQIQRHVANLSILYRKRTSPSCFMNCKSLLKAYFKCIHYFVRLQSIFPR